MTALATRLWGSGDRHALLLHGSGSSSATWWRVGPDLAAAGWSVTAADLPAHGDSPAYGGPVLPDTAAQAVLDTVGKATFDLVVGHSFGASTAVAALAARSGWAGRLVLEELPGPASVDWAAEAAALPSAARAAWAHDSLEIARTRQAHPRWAYDDCRHAVEDLRRCVAADVAAGLAVGATWPTLECLARDVTAMLLLAPDAPAVNRLADATALRGHDRSRAVARATEVRVMDTGHCIHRDDPRGWVATVTRFATG